MMRRRILLWMGLCLLFMSLFIWREGQAQEANQVRPGEPVYTLSGSLDVTPDDLEASVYQAENCINPESYVVTSEKKAKKYQKSVKSIKSVPPKATLYSVRKGDTLARIAVKTGISVADLRDINRMKGSALQIGQTLALKKDPNQSNKPFQAAEQAANDLSGAIEEEEEDGGIYEVDVRTTIERPKRGSPALLDHWNTPDEPKLLVKAAMGFLGAPYRLGGTSVTGIDCSAFVKKIYQVFDITLPRTAYEQSHVGLRIGRSDLAEGDLLFFNTRRSLGHVGIYIGNNEFVHASSRKRGVRIDNLSMPYFNKRFVRAVRLKGSDDGL
jgi:peptidoglycan endopeptidase LytE